MSSVPLDLFHEPFVTYGTPRTRDRLTVMIKSQNFQMPGDLIRDGIR